jgi:glutaredoxin
MKTRPLLFLILAALPVLPALAQYKVVRPDGSITYTDRPPIDSNVRVTSLNRKDVQQAAGGDTALPLELRQVAAKYPVTLYTSADCQPCDAGRKLLQQRGIPYAEKRVSTEEDALALERAVGGRSVPSLNVGPQPLRGFSESDWTVFLDTAGYPRESKLPKNWPIPAATPLVDKTAPAAPRATVPTLPSAEPPPEPPSSSIRF